MTLNFKQSCLTLFGISVIMAAGLFIFEIPIAVILIIESVFVGIIALIRKIPYDEIQKNMVSSVMSFVTPILMLLLIGALVASWIIGGHAHRNLLGRNIDAGRCLCRNRQRAWH